jgi:phosphoenolpyruvate synthase/pyruvate phosphate dikinase
MFGYLQKYELDPAQRTAVQGVAAAPGQMFGSVALRHFDRGSFAQLPPVLFLDEAIPEDIPDMEAAAAVVSALGGATSHAGIICRGMGKPCVTGTGAQPLDNDRCVRLPNGIRVREYSVVGVDANAGIVEFSDSPTIVPKYSVVQHRTEIVELFASLLDAERTAPTFRELSIEDQQHLAALTYRLRELRLLP